VFIYLQDNAALENCVILIHVSGVEEKYARKVDVTTGQAVLQKC